MLLMYDIHTLTPAWFPFFFFFSFCPFSCSHSHSLSPVPPELPLSCSDARHPYLIASAPPGPATMAVFACRGLALVFHRIYVLSIRYRDYPLGLDVRSLAPPPAPSSWALDGHDMSSQKYSKNVLAASAFQKP